MGVTLLLDPWHIASPPVGMYGLFGFGALIGVAGFYWIDSERMIYLSASPALFISFQAYFLSNLLCHYLQLYSPRVCSSKFDMA